MCAGVWDKNKTYMHYEVLEKKFKLRKGYIDDISR